MTRLLILIACLLLAACGRTLPVIPPPVLDVDPTCWQACDIEVPEWTPEDPDDPTVWDTYPAQVTIPLKAKLDRCSAVHHRACQQALRRGAELGVFKLTPEP